MNAKTMCRVGLVGFVVCVLTIPLFAADKYTFKPTQIRHGIVIDDTTGKWAYHWPRVMPAQWGSEIVIHCAKNAWGGDRVYEGGHERVPDQPGAIAGLQLRSTDNGETWTEEGDFKDRVTGPVKLPIDFTNPNFCARGNTRGTHYISYDRCKTWLGPWEAWVGLGGGCNGVFHLKNEGKTAVTITDQRHLSKFKDNCVTLLTTDQGRTWSLSGKWEGKFTSHQLLDYKTGKLLPPKGDYPIAIGPYTLRLGEDEILGVGRSRFGGVLHRSMDFGQSWKLEGAVHPEAQTSWVECWLVALGGQYPANPNPKYIIAVWGARAGMYGTDSEGKQLRAGPRARLSKDGGRTWSENVVQLRNDMEGTYHGFDSGEPVAYERTDGKIIMIYWWQTDARPQPHIAYTVFDPNVEGKE